LPSKLNRSPGGKSKLRSLAVILTKQLKRKARKRLPLNGTEQITYMASLSGEREGSYSTSTKSLRTFGVVEALALSRQAT
jgi:hypothetical protein